MLTHPVTRMMIAVHVDDILARGSMVETELFWAQMEAGFWTQDMGNSGL